MIKQVEEIFNEYENFKFVIPSNIKVVLNFLIEEWIFVSYLRYKYIIDDCVARSAECSDCGVNAKKRCNPRRGYENPRLNIKEGSATSLG